MIVGWVLLGVLGAAAVVILVMRGIEAYHRRVHERVVGADRLDLRELRRALPSREPPPNFVVRGLVPRQPYDQEAD